MVIDQRNGGASVTQTTSGLYTLDRWKTYGTVASKFSVQQNAGSVTPPVGFVNYLGCTSLSAYSVTSSDEFNLYQLIEGFNTADLGWGTANAKTITVSFWVRSSLTGTFGGSLRNSGGARSYPYTYTISSANTWEQKSVTIAGDTSGTWLTTNGVGIELIFGLGQGSSTSGTAGAWATASYTNATGATSVVGTNGATWYVTGVMLEVGTQATTFDYRSYGTEFALCQRYYQKTVTDTGGVVGFNGFNDTTTVGLYYYYFPVYMRTEPTLTTTGTATDYYLRTTGGATTNLNAVPTISGGSNSLARIRATVASGLTAGQGSALILATASVSYLGFNAEL
jgi:hypothetical protein